MCVHMCVRGRVAYILVCHFSATEMQWSRIEIYSNKFRRRMAAPLLLKTTITLHPCTLLCLKSGRHGPSSPTGLYPCCAVRSACRATLVRQWIQSEKCLGWKTAQKRNATFRRIYSLTQLAVGLPRQPCQHKGGEAAGWERGEAVHGSWRSTAAHP